MTIIRTSKILVLFIAFLSFVGFFQTASAGLIWTNWYKIPGTWPTRPTNPQTAGPTNLALDANGNIYVAARYITFSQVTGFWTQKYSPTGTALWGASGKVYNIGSGLGSYGRYGARGIGIHPISGDIYVLGFASDPNYGHYQIIRYDQAGNQIGSSWTYQFSNSETELPYGIAFDSQGYVYAAGADWTLGKYLLTKFSTSTPTGTLVWATTTGSLSVSNPPFPQGSIQIVNDRLYVGGEASLNNYSWMKLATSGVILQTSTFGAFNQYSANIAVDGLENVYQAGQAGIEGGVPNDYDRLITKHSSSGVFQWARRMNSSPLSNTSQEWGHGVSIDGSGNIYVSGGASDPSSGLVGAIVGKYDQLGNVLWNEWLASSSIIGQTQGDVKVDSSGYVYAVSDESGGVRVSKYLPSCTALLDRSWTDATLTAGVTPIKAVHLNELRDCANSRRRAVGLSPYSWTDATIVVSSTPVKAVHVNQLRTAISEIYTTCGRTAPTWTTDPGTLSAGQTVRKNHFTEMRSNILSAPTTCVRTAFVSSQTYSGNLGGLSGADATCQALASNAGMLGTFKAWLSTSDGASPASRFVASPNPYRRSDGLLLATSWTDGSDGTLNNPINRNELGVDVGTSTTAVWTNTSISGTANGANDCADWTSASVSVSGSVGTSTVSSSAWTTGGTKTCNSLARLYCIQQ